MWRWIQATGDLSRDGVRLGSGYSGHGRGRNNPALEAAGGVGPIPRGRWRLVSVGDSARTGPFTIVLAPEPATDTHGRSAFRIHGDSAARPGTASHGCIILPRRLREAMWRSGDRSLEVIRTDQPRADARPSEEIP